ncbi:MutS-related protein [Paraburkholderia sp. J12]|uniref:MutS-related protein n=1 Tax=Paraburkholderia sp. J12 TaxID=2805432 RepID=UPI002ABE70B3|nr:hypothetical protein [Paraburkholderia sp. J12]
MATEAYLVSAGTTRPTSAGTFRSLMFPAGLESIRNDTSEQPACFNDLNLDQVITAVVARGDEAILRPYFYSRYAHEDVVRYRLAIFRDIERPDVFALMTSFSEDLRRVRLDIEYAAKISSLRHQQMVRLEARAVYCSAVVRLQRDLASVRHESVGLRSLSDYLSAYLGSNRFGTLKRETEEIEAGLGAIQYGMLFRRDKVTVRGYLGERNFAELVNERFERFREFAAPEMPGRRFDDYGLNHIEEVILSYVANLFPASFQPLDDYLNRHETFIDEVIATLERELGFFLAYLTYIAPLKKFGLPFCYPVVSSTCKNVDVTGAFDLALASKLAAREAGIVPNNFFLSDQERILLVSGPNQGGKTTFARMFGQLHFLAGLGCPVPGLHAQLFLADQIYTHFERAEDITRLRSKLEDELVRLKGTCCAMRATSIVILNEIFSSTSLEDQILLSSIMLKKLLRADVLAVCVSFIDQLTHLDPKIVSMVTAVCSDDPAKRTFRIERRLADGLAYALSLAEKHGVTYEQLRRRIRP